MDDRAMEWAINLERGISAEEQIYQSNRARRRLFKLPPTIRNVDGDYDDVYKPYRVSFGPYFHGEEQCGPGERVKEASFSHFIRRSKFPLQVFLEVITSMVDELQDAYDLLDRRWQANTESFVQMMLVDGCFILELIRTTKDYAFSSSHISYDSDNPVISDLLDKPGEIKCYLHDMLLLENQLPIMLLDKLNMVDTSNNHLARLDILDNFIKAIATMFIPKRNLPRKNDILKDIVNGGELVPPHLLEVYRRCLVNQAKILPRRMKWTRSTFYNINIPSATELHKVGIGFTTSNTTSLVDIQLHRNTLMLPQIVVDGSTKSSFLNLMALEQVHNKFCNKEVTAYMFLMGGLVQGADDARLLQSRDIILTSLPAAELAKLFNRVTKDVSLDPDFTPRFLEMVAMLRKRYNKLSNEWRKDLFQTYLRSPWAIMSAMAAVLILILSVIQTVYTVLSYVRPK